MEIIESTEQSAATREHIAIEVTPPYDPLVAPIKERMENITTAYSICRINRNHLEANAKAYIPERLSIGPFHQGKEALKPMELHKWRYVYWLLHRKPHLERSLDVCVKELREMEHKARLFYGEDITLTSDEFVQLMLIDGCFLIELFLRHTVKGLRRRGDPIFNIPGMLYDLRCDIVLLENQIPLFVLRRLFEIVPVPGNCSFSITELAFRFFRNLIPGDQELHLRKFSQEGNHILDLIRQCFLPTYPRVVPKQNAQLRGLNSATELRSSGVKIKKARTEEWLDIKFTNGVLEIPPVDFQLHTESLFRNLIALEQCPCESTQHISSYVVLMRSIVASDRDVKLLNRKRILNSDETRSGEALELFDKLSKVVDLKDFYYDGLCEQVLGFEGKNLRALRKKMKTRNITSDLDPRSRIWLFLALSLLVLTLVGTLFSILSFSLHKL